jgi:L-alanine-DL-glutamate epimerase-like enolase superfamily enzyme
LALWDLWSKLQGKAVSEIALGKVAFDIPTSATLGICPKAEWAERISEVARFSAIKVKMNAEPDLDFLKAIRSQSSAAIRVDANCSWSGLSIVPLSHKLADLGVEFIEQPLPPSEDGIMKEFLRESCLPILADESCEGIADIMGLVGRFSGFNIKLVKCGGLTPALAMVRLGRELGLKTMVGCMLESSLLISAGAVAAQDADYADLDGSWLLGEDPFTGMEILGGKIRIGPGSGWGVQPKLPSP